MRVADDTLATIDFALVPVNESGRVTAIVLFGHRHLRAQAPPGAHLEPGLLAGGSPRRSPPMRSPTSSSNRGTEALGAQYANIGLLGDDKLVHMVHPRSCPTTSHSGQAPFRLRRRARRATPSERGARSSYTATRSSSPLPRVRGGLGGVEPPLVHDRAHARCTRGGLRGARCRWFDEVDFDAGLQAARGNGRRPLRQTLQRTRLADAQSQLVTALQDELLRSSRR